MTGFMEGSFTEKNGFAQRDLPLKDICRDQRDFDKKIDIKRKEWYSKYRCERMWRNWQTHKTQNLAVVTSCGFKSRHPHS